MTIENTKKQETATSPIAEILAERERQNEKWGEQNHPSFDTSLLGRSPQRMAEEYEIPTEDRAKWLCQEMARRGVCTFAHILIEEVCEVVGSCNEGEQVTREELIQVAAVCVQWIEAIDRRAGGS